MGSGETLEANTVFFVMFFLGSPWRSGRGFTCCFFLVVSAVFCCFRLFSARSRVVSNSLRFVLHGLCTVVLFFPRRRHDVVFVVIDRSTNRPTDRSTDRPIDDRPTDRPINRSIDFEGVGGMAEPFRLHLAHDHLLLTELFCHVPGR